MINRKPIFQAVAQIMEARGYERPFRWRAAEVPAMDAGIDAAFGAPAAQPVPEARPEPAAPPSSGRRVSQKGIALVHSFEQCRLTAYPDPGSKDGHPWTIGWGSTGPGIQKGVSWTQEQADARFERDLAQFGAKVDALLGSSQTTQHQFDALVSLAYNIGVGALAKSTVLRKHKAGDHKGAAAAFLMWNKNDGKVMRGLTRRRLAEADLYDD
jgi:GH24 family phage-related lysozyme (muramidase)